MFFSADSKFQALDGNPIDFVFWEDGQPEGMADDENCISVSKDETWRGRDCSEEKEFICAIKKSKYTYIFSASSSMAL